MKSDVIGVFAPCLQQGSVPADVAKASELGFAVFQPPNYPRGTPSVAEWKELLESAK